MSITSRFGANYEKLHEVLAPFLDALEGKDENIRIQGKRLEHANRENASWLSFYDQRRIELHTYVRALELEISRVRSYLLKGMERYPRDLSDRMKEKYIDSNEEYLKVYEVYLSVKELYEEYESVVDAFKQRGFALRNITNIRTAALEDVVI